MSLKHILVNNHEEFQQFVANAEKEKYWQDNCPENFEAFFGFTRKDDENTGEILETTLEYKGKFESEPTSYPAILIYCVDNDDFRGFACSTQLFDWVTLKDFKK